MVATGFGSGRLPGMPGTWGSVAALLAWGLLTLAWAAPMTTWMRLHPGHPLGLGVHLAGEAWFAVLVVGMTALAVKASDAVVRETGHKDPQFIVADEWAGMWITLWPLRWTLASETPWLAGPQAWRWFALLVVPFLAFRMMDILKPWPIRPLQDLAGGEGVVADDVVAGLMAIPVVLALEPWVMLWMRRGLG